ncbi:MAG: DUF480 domain-containing protein [Pirellulaceae bacterium]
MDGTAPLASETSDVPANAAPPKPLNQRQRRLLGVLIEKARTTPDAYPLSLNGLVTGANQKSNRSPLMSLTAEQVEDELIKMREAGVVAEVHSGGRVPKYRHFGYDYLGVKGVEAGVMTELLLRGEQTAGELRTRASRFEPIADLATLDSILKNLIERKLVITLTPAGRGQLFTHNLYLPDELEYLKKRVATRTEPTEIVDAGTPSRSLVATTAASPGVQDDLDALREEVQQLREEVKELRSLLEEFMA